MRNQRPKGVPSESEGKPAYIRKRTESFSIAGLLATFIILIWLALLPGVCLGATYYLDAVNGDDSYPGTSELLPWQTLSKAQSTVSDGDTVKLRNGNYGTFNERNIGHTAWTTYEADTGHTPIFDSIAMYHNQGALESNLIFRGISVYHGGAYLRMLSNVKFYDCTFTGDGFTPGDNSYAILLHSVNNVIIDRCTINGDGEGQGEGVSNGGIPKADFGKAYDHGIYFEAWGRNITINNCNIGSSNTGISAVGDSGIVISNNEIHHASDGITVHASNTAASGLTDPIVIEYNHIHTLYEYGATPENPDAGWHSDGIQFFDLEINHAVIRGNHIHYSDGDGMFLKGSKTATGNTDWLVENNLVYDTMRGQAHNQTVRLFNCDDATFRSNTIYGTVVGEKEGTPPTPMTFTSFDNNIINRITLYTIEPYNTIITHENNNILNTVIYGMAGYEWGENTVILGSDETFQALFNNYDSNDFTLASDSMAIDYGDAYYSPALDILGISRVFPPDAGCYEYVALSFIYGDVNGNGEVTSYDAALAARYAVGLEVFTDEQRQRADVSGNGEVSAYDAALIAQRAVGLIDRFPVEE